MAFKQYLKIEGINGSSTDAGHIGEIKILSYQLGPCASANQHGATTASKSGEPAVSNFSFIKEFDSCSPELFRASFSGSALPRVVLTEERFKGGSYPFVKVEVLELKDALVTSIMPAPRGRDSAPTEIVFLDAASLCFK